jgi:hypothetical protein
MFVRVTRGGAAPAADACGTSSSKRTGSSLTPLRGIARGVPDARRLFERALAGEVRLYLPSVCLTEGREAVRRRCQPRSEADALRVYVTWARQ